MKDKFSFLSAQQLFFNPSFRLVFYFVFQLSAASLRICQAQIAVKHPKPEEHLQIFSQRLHLKYFHIKKIDIIAFFATSKVAS